MAYSTMRPWLAGAAAAMCLVGTAHAQDAKTVFDARYAEMSAAMQGQDMSKMGAFLTPDYVMVDIQGNEHSAEDLRGMRGGRGPGGPGKPGDGKPGESKPPEGPRPVPKITIVSAKIDGSTAQVEQQTEIHMDRPGPDGKPAKMDITVLTDDVWVQSGGVWLLKSSDQKDVSVAKDGEVVFHQGK